MNKTEFTISGGKEVAEMLKRLPVEIENKVMVGAVRAGSKVISDRAKQLAPVETGALRRSIQPRNPRIGTKEITGGVRAGNKVAWYSHLVEFGTAERIVKNWVSKANRKKSGSGKPDKKAMTVRDGLFSKVKQPGNKQVPFMRTAMDAEAQAALVKMAEYARNRLLKEFGVDVSRNNRK
jgi:HK97 gp10 family phage protein